MGAASRDIQHRRREIDAEGFAGGCYCFGCSHGCRAATASDVEHALAQVQRRAGQQQVTNRREHAVASLGVVRPLASALAVPCLELFSVGQCHRPPGLDVGRFGSIAGHH